MAEKTMTIAMKFDATIAMLQGAEVEGFTIDQAIEFLADRKVKATRKSTSERKVKPETQACRDAVQGFLAEVEGEFANKDVVAALEGAYSSQAVAAALRFFKAEGAIVEVETEKKGSKLFSLA